MHTIDTPFPALFHQKEGSAGQGFPREDVHVFLEGGRRQEAQKNNSED